MLRVESAAKAMAKATALESRLMAQPSRDFVANDPANDGSALQCAAKELRTDYVGGRGQERECVAVLDRRAAG